jgi:predicted ester cyclase
VLARADLWLCVPAAASAAGVARRRATMSTEENKATVRRLYDEYYGKRNDAVLDELIAPEYVLRNAWTGWRTRPVQGPAVYKAFMQVWWGAFPDFAASIEQMVAEGDRVLTICTWSGTHQGVFPRGPVGAIEPTGRRLNLPGMIVSRIVAGKIVEEWESANWGSVWQQLGALPTPARAGT